MYLLALGPRKEVASISSVGSTGLPVSVSAGPSTGASIASTASSAASETSAEASVAMSPSSLTASVPVSMTPISSSVSTFAWSAMASIASFIGVTSTLRFTLVIISIRSTTSILILGVGIVIPLSIGRSRSDPRAVNSSTLVLSFVSLTGINPFFTRHIILIIFSSPLTVIDRACGSSGKSGGGGMSGSFGSGSPGSFGSTGRFGGAGRTGTVGKFVFIFSRKFLS